MSSVAAVFLCVYTTAVCAMKAVQAGESGVPRSQDRLRFPHLRLVSEFKLTEFELTLSWTFQQSRAIGTSEEEQCILL